MPVILTPAQRRILDAMHAGATLTYARNYDRGSMRMLWTLRQLDGTTSRAATRTCEALEAARIIRATPRPGRAWGEPVTYTLR